MAGLSQTLHSRLLVHQGGLSKTCDIFTLMYKVALLNTAVEKWVSIQKWPTQAMQNTHPSNKWSSLFLWRHVGCTLAKPNSTLHTCGEKKRGSGKRWLVLLLCILDTGMLINNSPTLINNNPNQQRKTIQQRRWEENLFFKVAWDKAEGWASTTTAMRTQRTQWHTNVDSLQRCASANTVNNKHRL